MRRSRRRKGGTRLLLSPPTTAVGAGGVHILMHTLAHLPPSKTQDKYPKRRQIQPLCAALGRVQSCPSSAVVILEDLQRGEELRRRRQQ